MLALPLALLVGFFQFLAGLLRPCSAVDYISNPVVLGYITGARLLIGIGQLPALTETAGTRGDVFTSVSFWIQGLGATSWMALAMALGTMAIILGLRRINPNLPGAILALAVATLLSYVLDLQSRGMKVVADMSPVPGGLPDITLPDMTLLGTLTPLAIACTVLSLVESSAVARAIAATTGQRLDTSVEFVGQGLANMSAAFLGGYPTSGSLSRSALNHKSGAQTRLGGVYAGLMMVAVLLVLGPVVNVTPVASLAGLLVVVAIDLVNVARIKVTMRSQWSDRIAFLVTLFGTWFIPLDKAIYLGVGISLVLFLRQARLLVISEMRKDSQGGFQEVDRRFAHEDFGQARIRILHIEGHLFFGVVGELQSALDEMIRDPHIRVLILRLKRARGMDVSVATALAAVAARLAEHNRYLLLAGVRPDIMRVLERTAVADSIGKEMIFTSQSQWFASLHGAVDHAIELIRTEDSMIDGVPVPMLQHYEPLRDGEVRASIVAAGLPPRP